MLDLQLNQINWFHSIAYAHQNGGLLFKVLAMIFQDKAFLRNTHD